MAKSERSDLGCQRCWKQPKILRSNDDTHLSPSTCTSTGTVRRPRAPAVCRFSKDSLTGRRKTHCQYRPRSSATANQVPSLRLSDVSVANDDEVSGIGGFHCDATVTPRKNKSKTIKSKISRIQLYYRV